MRRKTVGLISLLLFAVILLFHLSAKKLPTEEETHSFDFLRQPRMWQGKPAPDVSLDLLNGEKFVLSEHVGKKAIVLNFFATWCGPCKSEMPELVRFAGKHKDEPFLMIGVDADEREEAVREFVKEFGVSYPVAIDKSNTVQKLFSVRSFPTTVFIGADGIVHLYEVGSIQNADVAFEAPYQAALSAIRSGAGITREAFARLHDTAVQPAAAAEAAEEKKKDPGDEVPPGRAREIADKMNCPCGCSHSLMECTCKTSKAIKARLKAESLEEKKDEEVIKALNKEFCMK